MDELIVLPDWDSNEYLEHKANLDYLPKKKPSDSLSEVVFRLSSIPVTHFDVTFKFEDYSSLVVQQVAYHDLSRGEYNHKFVGVFQKDTLIAWKQKMQQGSNYFYGSLSGYDVSKYSTILEDWNEFSERGVLDPGNYSLLHYFVRAVKIVEELADMKNHNYNHNELLTKPNYYETRRSIKPIVARIEYFKGIDSEIPLQQNGVCPELSSSGELLRNPF